LKLDGRIFQHAVDFRNPDVVNGIPCKLRSIRWTAFREDMSSNSPCSRKDLPSRQEGIKLRNLAREEILFDLNEIVFVAAKSMATEVIYRVVVDTDFVL